MKTYAVHFDDIPVEASDTDDTLFEKAKEHLPQALKRMGEKVGQEAWDAMEREIRKSPLKIKNSSSDKAKFLRDAAAEFSKAASASEKKSLMESIYQQLKERRDAKV